MKREKKVVRFCVFLVLITLILSGSVLGASSKKNYKKAYRNVISQFEKRNKNLYYSENHYRYSLIYIDKNKIPELVCDHYTESGRTGPGDLEVYTVYKGKVRRLFGGTVPQYFLQYRPKKNSILLFRNAAVSGYFVASVSIEKIQKGKLITLKKELPLSSYPELQKNTKKYKTVIGKYSKKKILKKLR